MLMTLIATPSYIFRLTVSPSAYLHHYDEAFASDSIFPFGGLDLCQSFITADDLKHRPFQELAEGLLRS